MKTLRMAVPGASSPSVFSVPSVAKINYLPQTPDIRFKESNRGFFSYPVNPVNPVENILFFLLLKVRIDSRFRSRR